MAEPETVDFTPPTINFKGVVPGLGPPLHWGFGFQTPAGEVPDNLTGREVVLVLAPGSGSQVRHEPDVSPLTGDVSWPVPLTLQGTTKYVLLIAQTPGGRLIARAQGQIEPLLNVTPEVTP